MGAAPRSEISEMKKLRGRRTFFELNAARDQVDPSRHLWTEKSPTGRRFDLS